LPNHRTTETLKNWLTETLACRPAAWARLKASPLGYRLARGAFWSLVGAVLSRGLGLVATIVVARILGKEGFGELGIIQSTVGMFGTFAGFGLGLTATKHVAELREKDPERASRILALSAILSWGTGALAAALLALFAPSLAATTLLKPNLSGELAVGSLLVLFGAVSGAQTGALAGFEAFRRIAKLNLYTGLAAFPSLTLGCWLSGLRGAVWGLVISQGLGCLLNRVALAKEAGAHRVRLWSPRWAEEMPVVWKFSLPAVGAALLTSAARWASHALIVREPGGLSAMATCTVAIQFQTLLLFLPGLVTQAALPIMSNLRTERTGARLRSFVRRNLSLNLLVTAAFAAPMVMLSRPLLGLYGHEYEGDQIVLVLFLVAGILASGSRLAAQALAAYDAMRFTFLTNLAWGGLLLTLVYVMLDHGAMALGVAQTVAYLAHLGLPVLYLHFSTTWGARKTVAPERTISYG
jgi:O-antigen/teichoic acid export membrane protein